MIVGGRMLGGWLAVALAAAPAVASADDRIASSNWRTDDDDRFGRFVRLEADALAVVGTLPTPLFGADLAVAVGRPQVHVRLGGVVAAARPFALGAGSVGTVLETTQVQLCAASHLGIHRFRLCGGGQAGVMHLQWHGFSTRGARQMPWVGMRGDGDYSLALGRRLDVRAGVGLVAPLVGPRLLALAPDGGRIDSVRAGVVATVVHAGIGLKLR